MCAYHVLLFLSTLVFSFLSIVFYCLWYVCLLVLLVLLLLFCLDLSYLIHWWPKFPLHKTHSHQGPNELLSLKLSLPKTITKAFCSHLHDQLTPQCPSTTETTPFPTHVPCSHLHERPISIYMTSLEPFPKNGYLLTTFEWPCCYPLFSIGSTPTWYKTLKEGWA